VKANMVLGEAKNSFTKSFCAFCAFLWQDKRP
jgi:hypothetical protein